VRLEPGGSGAALRCGVPRGISHLQIRNEKGVRFVSACNARLMISISQESSLFRTYPRAKMGVSGRLQDVCRRRSSRGLCAERFGKPLLANLLRDEDDEVTEDRSGGSVWPGPGECCVELPLR
jgi:hypothetical protein